MSRKWTKWAVGVTGATAFAVTLGWIQMKSSVPQEYFSPHIEPVHSALANDSIFVQTISTIKQSEFTILPYFVSYEYTKEGQTQHQLEEYLNAKEQVLQGLDWGMDVYPAYKDDDELPSSRRILESSTPDVGNPNSNHVQKPLKSDRKTRGSK